MACVSVPLATAVAASATKNLIPESFKKNPFVSKSHWLIKMMLGGSFLLAIEHIYHGEIIFTPPFLTAIKDGQVNEMLSEMATRGVAMTVLLSAVWVAMVVVSTALEKRAAAKASI
jgi:hypothetical protein